MASLKWVHVILLVHKNNLIAMKVPVSHNPSALHSTSMNRAPAAPSSFVRGKSGHVPFWPGGLDKTLGLDEDAVNLGGANGLQTIAPGLSRGLRLPGDVEDSEILDEFPPSGGFIMAAKEEVNTVSPHRHLLSSVGFRYATSAGCPSKRYFRD